MNILFVHEIDWANKVVFDMHSLSELLSSLGHKVFVIDFPSSRNRNRLADFITLKTKSYKLPGRAHKDACITLLQPGFIKAPILDRVLAFFTHYKAINEVINNEKIDILILYSVPTNGYQAIKIAKKHRIPVIFRSIDILHQLVPSKLFSPFTFLLETWVYSNSDKILTLSPGLSEYVIRMKAPKDKVELLLFGVDTKKFSPFVQSKELRKRLGLSKNDLVVLYIGTLFEFSGLDIYLNQFVDVVERLPQAKLVIVGGGALFNTLKKQVSELELSKNVILTGFQPFDMMPKFINMSNVCINPFKINNVTKDIIPGKILQYLACGKPVVSTPLPGMVYLLKGQECGVVYSDMNKLAQNTFALLKDKNLANNIGKKGYTYVKHNHDERCLARKLEIILTEQTKR